jgi:O-antigen/teichoic acid export membrane protein
VLHEAATNSSAPTAGGDPHRQSDSASGVGLARNTLLNLAGLGVPLVVGFAVIPVIASHLGPVRFGLLGLAWALLEYFSLVDGGLGRATTRFVAERAASRRDEIGPVVVASIASQLGLATIAGAAVALAAPAVVGPLLPIPEGLRSEAVATLRMLGAMLPVVVLGLGLRGILEGAQRFDVSTLIRLPSSSATFLVPAVGAVWGLSLPQIMLFMLLARAATCAVMVVAVGRVLSGVRWSLPRQWRPLRPLLAYGGWVSVSNVVSPLLVQADRFVLGALAGLAAVGYYTAPYELTTRMLVVAGSLTGAIFPAVSAFNALGARQDLQRTFAMAVRTIALVMVPPAATLVAFAPDVLTAWMGEATAGQGATALRILAAGVVVNALAFVPYACLQALGRADLTAKFHVAELVLHLPLTWWLVREFGVAGAAGAWSIRVTLDAALLFAAARSSIGVSPRQLLGGRGGSAMLAMLALAGVLAAGTAVLPPLSPARAVAAAVAGLAFVYVVWRHVLTAPERAALASSVTRVARGTRAA